MSFSSFLTNTKENTILKTPFYSNLKGSQQYSNEKSLSTQRNKNNYEENLHKKRIISKSPLDLFFPKIAQTKRVGYFERQENINNKTFNQKNNQDVVQYKITKPRKKMFCNLISFYTKKFKFNTPIPNNKLKILKPIFHRPSRSIFVLEKLKKDLKSLKRKRNALINREEIDFLDSIQKRKKILITDEGKEKNIDLFSRMKSSTYDLKIEKNKQNRKLEKPTVKNELKRKIPFIDKNDELTDDTNDDELNIFSKTPENQKKFQDIKTVVLTIEEYNNFKQVVNDLNLEKDSKFKKIQPFLNKLVDKYENIPIQDPQKINESISPIINSVEKTETPENSICYKSPDQKEILICQEETIKKTQNINFYEENKETGNLKNEILEYKNQNDSIIEQKNEGFKGVFENSEIQTHINSIQLPSFENNPFLSFNPEQINFKLDNIIETGFKNDCFTSSFNNFNENQFNLNNNENIFKYNENNCINNIFANQNYANYENLNNNWINLPQSQINLEIPNQFQEYNQKNEIYNNSHYDQNQNILNNWINPISEQNTFNNCLFQINNNFEFNSNLNNNFNQVEIQPDNDNAKIAGNLFAVKANPPKNNNKAHSQGMGPGQYQYSKKNKIEKTRINDL